MNNPRQPVELVRQEGGGGEGDWPFLPLGRVLVHFCTDVPTIDSPERRYSSL